MKRYAIAFILAAAGLLAGCAPVAFAQATDNMIYVKQFPGNDVGTKVANAMRTCNPNAQIPCILVIDPSLAVFATGTFPVMCSKCSIADFRQGSTSPGAMLAAIGFAHIAAVGDSITQGVAASTGNDWVSLLTRDIGVGVANLGSCGQTASQIARRVGALPVNVTVVGGFIPTSGNVQVTFSPVSPVDSCNGPSVISTIQGVVGSLAELSGLDYFTPTTYPAAPVAVAPGSPWTPVLGETYQGFLTIWAGRNGIGNTDNLSDIAAIAALAVNKSKTLVISVENTDKPSEYIGQADYNTIAALNAALKATYSGNGTYQDNYLDIRSYLVSQYDPTNAQDVIDHGHDVPPSSIRPVKTSTFLGDVTTTTQTTVLVSNTDMSTIITATGEKMEISGFTGSSSPFTATVTRGYAGTTPGTYANGDSFSFIEPLHFGDPGQALIEGQIFNWIRTHSSVGPPYVLASLFDLLHERAQANTAGTGVSTAPHLTDANTLTTFPSTGWSDNTTANAPTGGSFYLTNIGVACCVGKYSANIAVNVSTGAMQSRSENNGVWTGWVSGLSVGAITGMGAKLTDVNLLTGWPNTGWADNTTLNTPGTGSWLIGINSLGCCAGYGGYTAINLTTGAIATRAENNSSFTGWSIPSIAIATGTAALGTSAIASGACAAVVTKTATNVLTTDVVQFSFATAPVATYNSLAVKAYATSGNTNFVVCNPTAGSITPAAQSLNWKVSR